MSPVLGPFFIFFFKPTCCSARFCDRRCCLCCGRPPLWRAFFATFPSRTLSFFSRTPADFFSDVFFLPLTLGLTFTLFFTVPSSCGVQSSFPLLCFGGAPLQRMDHPAIPGLNLGASQDLVPFRLQKSVRDSPSFPSVDRTARLPGFFFSLRWVGLF